MTGDDDGAATYRSPRFNAYSPEFSARLNAFAQALYGCHLTLMALLDETEGEPTPGSLAEQDVRHLATHEPPYLPAVPRLILFQAYAYVSAAGEHMRGLGALYAKHEVMIPPPALVRCVLEHCARVRWLLQTSEQPAEDRLARAYLEQLFSAQERKKVSGRISGKDSAHYHGQRELLNAVRKNAAEVFGEPVVDAQGVDRIRGQTMPGLQECVAELLKQHEAQKSAADQRGVYDYISNASHPTVYTVLEVWRPAQVDGRESLTSALTIEAHRQRVELAIVPFCETLDLMIDYHGWPRRPMDELLAQLDRLLIEEEGNPEETGITP